MDGISGSVYFKLKRQIKMYNMRIRAVLGFFLALLFQITVSGQLPGREYSLKQLIDSALQNNYLLRANEKQTEIKQAEIDLLRLNYQPRISTGATASVWKFLLPNKQRLLGNSLTDVYTDISVYQTIYDWGENKVKKTVVEDEITLSREIQRQLRTTIIWGVADAYFELLKANSQLEVHHNTLNQLKSHLRYAENLYKIGKVSGVDVLKINVQISVEEKAIQKAENAALAQIINIRRLCFLKENESIIVRYQADSIFLAEQLRIFVPDTLYKQTFDNHPSMRAANLKLELEEKQKELSRLQNRPELYSYGISTWEHGYLPFGKNFNYNIGVGIQYTIPYFGGSGFKTRIIQSEIRKDQISDERTQLVFDLKKEIDLTLNEIEDIKSEISSNNRIISLAQETLDNALIMYRSGQGTIIDVLDAQTILSETTINQQKSRIAFLQALAKLNYLTGNDENPY